MIYFTSDLHFCHDREFMFNPRGFDSIDDHDKTIINNWNAVVKDDDQVYVLGDLMLNDNEKGIALIRQLKGKIHIVLGNHDTDNRVALFKAAANVVEIVYATIIKYKGYVFYLSHYPTITGDMEHPRRAQHLLYNLYGHTHQKTNFFNDVFFMYHVGIDSHANRLVSIDQIIEDCNKQKEKTKEKELEE